MKKRLWIAIGIFAITLAVRFFLIEQIPGEWYGDISNVHEYELQVLSGQRPFYFFQSPGPFYHYLIAPIVLLYQNHGFETYKTASIAVSLLGLAATYLFVSEISSVALALLTSLTMSASLWYLVWSRLGNSQIVIPALVALMSLFIVRYMKKKKFRDLLLASVFASLGWYTYPQTFIFPAAFIVFLMFYLVIKKELVSQFRPLGLTLVLMVITIIPFITIIKADRGNFGSRGYVGEKILPVFKLPVDQLVGKTLFNWEKTLSMLHARGDKTFRVNVSGRPQLDAISGIFFLLGFLYFLKKRRRIWLFFILWMLLILPLPSISPVIPDAEIPNSARTIAITPFVFLLVSAGILWSYEFFINNYNRYKNYKYLVGIFFSAIFACMVFSNLTLYFKDYAAGLPDKNLAPGKIIANYIDTLPAGVSVYFSSCCWGQWGEPEPKGIAYQMHKEGRFADFNKLIQDCGEIKSYPSVIVTDPGKTELADKFMKCSQNSKVKDLISADGIPVAKLVIAD